MFFYKYFKQRTERQRHVKPKSTSEEMSSDEGELEEEEIEKALFEKTSLNGTPSEDEDDDYVSNDSVDDADEDEFETLETFVSDDENMIEEEEEEPEDIKSKRKSKGVSNLKTVNFTGSTFASAEEFAHLLEETPRDRQNKFHEDQILWKNRFTGKHQPSKRFKSSHRTINK